MLAVEPTAAALLAMEPTLLDPKASEGDRHDTTGFRRRAAPSMPPPEPTVLGPHLPRCHSIQLLEVYARRAIAKSSHWRSMATTHPQIHLPVVCACHSTRSVSPCSLCRAPPCRRALPWPHVLRCSCCPLAIAHPAVDKGEVGYEGEPHHVCGRKGEETE